MADDDVAALPKVPDPEDLGYDPEFAKVETTDGRVWTAVLDRSAMRWRYLVDAEGERAPWPLPPTNPVAAHPPKAWRSGPFVGDPEEPDPLPVWTIYLNPPDYERKDGADTDLYVMRKWTIGPGEVTPTGEVWTADTLDEIRALVPWTCVRLERDADDLPVIVESWL